MATTPEILNVLYYSFKIDSADKEHSLTFLICVLHSIDIANCEFKIFWGKNVSLMKNIQVFSLSLPKQYSMSIVVIVLGIYYRQCRND